MNRPIIVTLIISLVFFLIIFVLNSRLKNKNEKRIPNYRAMFIIGIAWVPIGIATDNISLWGIGIAFLIAGLVNKKRWGQEARWVDLSPAEKKMKLLFIGGLTVLLIIGIALFIFSENNT